MGKKVSISKKVIAVDILKFMAIWGQPFLSISGSTKARFKRRILHVPNLMQMSENNRFFPFALDSAHVKCDV